MRTVIVGTSPVARDIFEHCAFCGLDVGMLESPEDSLTQADWIIDVSGPDIPTQRKSLKMIAENCSSAAIVTADTSVATVSELISGFHGCFAHRFTVSHFFVPTSRVALVELVNHEKLDPEVASRIQAMLGKTLDRVVVPCRDQPGFLGNRLGLFLTASACIEALKQGWHFHVVDEALSRSLGTSRLGAFGVADLVGSTVLVQLAKALQERLPPSDPWRQLDLSGFAKRVSNPGFRGFYKKSKNFPKRQRYDFGSNQYVPCEVGAADPGLSDFIQQLSHDVGAYAKTVARNAALNQHDLPLVMTEGFGWSRDGLLQSVISRDQDEG